MPNNKSQAITTSHKKVLSIDNFDTMTLEERLALIDRTFDNFLRILTTPVLVT
jgi:hypothetical protein